ncbi:hypothetical protein A3770_05p38600 [Chloropicon primus]|uniref:Uncharacterized protein n=1 Tax=Chloropicon primus TaxID=1764295 RepID=A0A5B8MPX8_9CHLO|nr:hypothetical protein A3770_05p38600 [Chloropicon primus]|eukprot:QDZ21342.1 hypothetical protein A3770_05p38600 [Chloropicon primus]
MTVSLSPRSWRSSVFFSPRGRKHRTPRTPLDHVDSLDGQFGVVSASTNVATPRPARKVCDHCGTEAASARLHCVRGTTRLEDESHDYHISLCDKCMSKEQRGELESKLRTARHKVVAKRVKKVEKMKMKMRKFWKDMVRLFTYEASSGASDPNDLKDLQELDKNLSASFNNWLLKRSMRKGGKGSGLKYGGRVVPETARDGAALEGGDSSSRQSTWMQWAFTRRTPGRISRSDSDSNSDSSILAFLRPSCFSVSPRDM